MASSDCHMQERETEKAKALADIATALHSIGDEQRDPDRWERVCLVRAFAAAFSGCYSLAAAEAQLALTLPSERSPTASLPNDPIFNQCDLSPLMRVLPAARAEPARRFPHFGRVGVR